MNTEMTIRKMPVTALKPAKYNPRKDLKPGDPAYEKIKRSLHDFGYVDPVIWNEVTGNIVGGHQRYKVLTAEGATEIDCVVVHIENPQDEKALNIALNKAVGEWEPKALADLLSDLQLSGYDVGATGFDAAEVDELFSKVHDKDVKDDDTELDAETIVPFVKSGDLWTLGRHRMLCGDATSEDDLNRLMGDVKANLVVTDPPYNVAYESADGKSIQNDSMADGAFYEFLLTAFRNWLPHLAEGASAYIFHADTEGLNFRRAFKEAGFHISGVCIWVKNSLVLGRSPYQWQHEPVLFGWLPNGKALETPADENMFRQLRLNQWVKQSVRWMPMDKWDACAGMVDPYALEGRACYAGLDLSSTSDLTTLVLVFPPADEDGVYTVLPFFWLPEETLPLRVRRDHVMYDVWERQKHLITTEGNVVHYGFIEQFICRLAERYSIREIAYDRWNASMMVQTLQDDGFTMVPFGQGFKDMSPPTKELMRLVLEQKIAHGGHPILRWNMDNAYVRTDPAGNIKLDKEKSTEKVDGAVALVMGLDRAMKNLNGGSIYDVRDMLTLDW